MTIQVTTERRSILVTRFTSTVQVTFLETGTRTIQSGGGSGDVTGQASSTDNGIVLFDGTTGKIVKDMGFLPAASQSVRRNSGGTAWEAFTPGGGLVTYNNQVDNYTLALTDQDKVVTITKATANTLTIPTNASVAFPVGTIVYYQRLGAGQTTISGAGVTITYSAGAAVTTDPDQYIIVTLIKTATDSWYVLNGSPSAKHFSSKVVYTDATNLTLTNQALAEQALNNTVNYNMAVDSTGFLYIRLTGRVGVVSTSVNTPRLYPSYSVNAGNDWTNLGSGTGSDALSLETATGLKTTAWIALPSAARADILFRITMIGGDGAQDPQVNQLYMEFKN